jgi:hypothetical protein
VTKVESSSSNGDVMHVVTVTKAAAAAAAAAALAISGSRCVAAYVVHACIHRCNAIAVDNTSGWSTAVL